MACSNDNVTSRQYGSHAKWLHPMPASMDAAAYRIAFGEERLFRVIAVELRRSRLKLKRSRPVSREAIG
jgi:hypothetical protein